MEQESTLTVPVSFLQRLHSLHESAYVTMYYLPPYHLRVSVRCRGEVAYDYVFAREVSIYCLQLELDCLLDDMYAEMKYKLENLNG